MLKNLEAVDFVQNKIKFKGTFFLNDGRKVQKGRAGWRILEIQATCPLL
jgi:hypothetical protein